MNHLITDEQWQSYEDHGYLKLGKMLDDDELGVLQRRIDDIMSGRAGSLYERLRMQLDGQVAAEYGSDGKFTPGFKGATLDYRKIEGLEFDPHFLAYMQKPIFRRACARLYGEGAPISCMRAMFMNKPARKGRVLKWHQDGGESWGLDQHPLLTAWTALDPATIANGCVKIIPESHKLGLLSREGHQLSAEHAARYCPPEKVVQLELKPGEAVLLHNWLVHGSDINHTDIPRRAFSVCYMRANTRRTADGTAFPIIFGEGALEAAGGKLKP